MYRRLCLIAIAALWTNVAQARVLKDLAELALDLARFARPVADCDAACLSAAREGAGAVVKNSVRVRGRIAIDEFRAYLGNVAPAIVESPPLAQLMVKKGNAAWQRHEEQLTGIMSLFGRIDGLVEGVSKLPRTKFAQELASTYGNPGEGVPEFARSLMHQVGDLLIKHPASEKNFLALYALAHMLDGGAGEYSAYARQLIAFRVAMSEGHAATLGQALQLKTLFAIKDASAEGLLPRMAQNLARAKSAGQPADIAAAFENIRSDNQALVNFVRQTQDLKLSLAEFGIAEAPVADALRAFRELVELVTKAEGLMSDIDILTIMQKNYLGLDGWRETIKTLIRRNPDLADSPEFHELMRFDDFRGFAESTLLR